MKKLTLRQQKHAAYNTGYKEAINSLEPKPAGFAPDFLFYYYRGHQEGYPQRLIPTTIMTRSGPITEHCSTERALYLASIVNRF